MVFFNLPRTKLLSMWIGRKTQKNLRMHLAFVNSKVHGPYIQVTAIYDDSIFFHSDLKVGMKIYQVNGMAITSSEQGIDLITSVKDIWIMMVITPITMGTEYLIRQSMDKTIHTECSYLTGGKWIQSTLLEQLSRAYCFLD